MQSQAEWVAVDWGTSNVRAWGIAADGTTAFSTSSDRGMGRIERADYPDVLQSLVGEQVDGRAEVIICGMAGARQGWREAPYVDTPANLNALRSRAVSPADWSTDVSAFILPGVCQRSDGHEDVMRGEETQLLGLVSLEPGFSGTAVLPGTHSKWVELDAGVIVRFSTAMTGELYDVLATHSVLRHSLAGERTGPTHDAGLAEGIDAGLTDPALITSMLFRTRAASLLSGRDSAWCAGYLSGLLVGSEIAGHRSWLAAGTVPLIGSERLSAIYAQAFDRIGATTRHLDAADATIAGLKAAREQAA